MKKTLIITTMLILGVCCCSSIAYSETVCPTDTINYECECAGIGVVDDIFSPSDLESILSGPASKTIGNVNIYCFNGRELFTDTEMGYDTINISATSTKTTVIYNLGLVAVAGSQLSIGDNVELNRLQISGTPVTAIKVTGSNVEINNSNITATGTAIKVEDTASEVKVQNTTITSAAVGISYAGNKKVTASGMTLNNVATPISKTEGKDVVILQDVVGKKFNTDGTQVARVAGLLEDIKTCEGSVALNIRALVDNVPQITYHGDCAVEQITKDSPLCVYHGVGTVPTTESDIAECVTSGSCECFSEGLCKFECTDLNLSGNQTVKVAYTGISDPTNNIDLNTYSYSANMTLSDLGSIIATEAPTMPATYGGEATGGYGGVESDGGDSGMGMAKTGCSMVGTSATLDLGMLLIFIALTAIPVAVIIPIRNRRK